MKATIAIEGKSYDTFPGLVRNDEGWDIVFTLAYNDDSVVDITGATITFKVKAPTASVNKIEGVCALTALLTGICTYTVQSGDLDTADNYEGELQVALASGDVHTVKLGTVPVIEDLP